MDHAQHHPWTHWLPIAGVFVFIAVLTALWGWSVERFMAVFFLTFAAFKLSDLRGFATGYAEYDLIAMRWHGWGYLYPFIELGFGIGMALGAPVWLLWTELFVMLVSGIGVVRKLARHEEVQCVCLGTRLKIPLTFVTLIEDFGMAVLALLLLMK
jgi:hypothetical protein